MCDSTRGEVFQCRTATRNDVRSGDALTHDLLHVESLRAAQAAKILRECASLPWHCSPVTSDLRGMIAELIICLLFLHDKVCDTIDFRIQMFPSPKQMQKSLEALVTCTPPHECSSTTQGHGTLQKLPTPLGCGSTSVGVSRILHPVFSYARSCLRRAFKVTGVASPAVLSSPQVKQVKDTMGVGRGTYHKGMHIADNIRDLGEISLHYPRAACKIQSTIAAHSQGVRVTRHGIECRPGSSNPLARRSLYIGCGALVYLLRAMRSSQCFVHPWEGGRSIIRVYHTLDFMKCAPYNRRVCASGPVTAPVLPKMPIARHR